MIDDAPLDWVAAPPAPPPSAAARAAATSAVAALRDGGAVTLTGVDGSGRRTAALVAVGELGGAAHLVPGLPWRAPEALRAIARGLGTAAPPELRPALLVELARAAMADHPGGTLVVDARIHAEPGLVAALRPPSGWRAVLLAPRDLDPAAAWGPVLDLADPPTPVALDGDDAAVHAAASYFDPWEGAPRALLPAVADRSEEATAAAVDRLLAAARLRPAGDGRRVLPTVRDYQARPEPTDPLHRPIAERFVSTMATLCGRTTLPTLRYLSADRANVMTALALWQDVAPVGLVAGFAHALPMLLDDLGCHEAAKLVIAAGRSGDHATQRLVADAQRRLAGG